MKGFIEIKTKDKYRRLINVNFIEEVCERDGGACSVYMAFNSPMAYEQDYFEVIQSYDEIVALIKEAQNDN
jgi:hypothetical protein